MVYAIIIFSIISFGFSNRYVSQVNDKIWLNILLKYEIEANNFKVSEPVENKIPLKDNNVSSGKLNYLPTLDDSTDKDSTLKIDTSEKDSTLKIDSTSILNDSNLVAKDTLVVDSSAFDSTARLKYFRYQREDVPYVRLRVKKPSAFFVQPSPTNKTRTVEIDSTGKFVTIKEKVAGQETKILLQLPIEEYIQMKLALRERQLWEDLGYKYELKESKKELSQLITDITNIDIPLPSVGALNYFWRT